MWKTKSENGKWNNIRQITMATLTKKDLLEAIEDMPMDAQICSIKKMEFIKGFIDVVQSAFVKYDDKHNRIIITC